MELNKKEEEKFIENFINTENETNKVLWIYGQQTLNKDIKEAEILKKITKGKKYYYTNDIKEYDDYNNEDIIIIKNYGPKKGITTIMKKLLNDEIWANNFNIKQKTIIITTEYNFRTSYKIRHPTINDENINKKYLFELNLN